MSAPSCILLDMGASTHDPKALAQFQSGEERFVYARHKLNPTGPLFYLEDGQAASLRSWAKEHLECFIPRCPDRALTTVSRRYKRDGFTHRAGAGRHSRESLFHEQGKALVARWVTQRYPTVSVVIEQASNDRTRRADVMLTWPDGRKVAVEVQYAALSATAWQARHDSYRSQGIVDVWLFGHHGLGRERHLRPARAHTFEDTSDVSGIFELSPVHRAIAAAGMPIFWISPIEEQIGTAVIDGGRLGQRAKAEGWHRRPHLVGPRPPTESDERAALRIDAIWDCGLDSSTGLITPAISAVAQARQLIDDEAAHLDALERAARQLEAQRRREREQWEASERAARQAHLAIQEAAAAARAAKAQERAARRRADWHASPENQAFRTAVEGVERTIALGGGPDWYRGVYFDAERLRATIYMRLIHGRAGETFRYFDAITTITSATSYAAESDRAIHRPVRDYLWHLHRNGLLDWPNPTQRFIPHDVDLMVVADLTGPLGALCQWCQFPVDSSSHQSACGLAPVTTDGTSTPPPSSPQPPKPADNPYRYCELPDWHGDIGMLDHYAPGLRPIFGWQVEVFRERVRCMRTDSLTPQAIMEAYEHRWVTESAVESLLNHFVNTRWLRCLPSPHGPVWVPEPRAGAAASGFE